MTSVKMITCASLVSLGLALASGCASTPVPLSSSDNLATWRYATDSQRAWLCEDMALTKPVSSPSDLCSCISTTADDGGYDFMTVSEVVEVCVGLLKADGL